MKFVKPSVVHTTDLSCQSYEQNWRQVKTVFSSPHCISRLNKTVSKLSVTNSLDLSQILLIWLDVEYDSTCTFYNGEISSSTVAVTAELFTLLKKPIFITILWNFDLKEPLPWRYLAMALDLQKPSLGLGLTETWPLPWSRRCLISALQRPSLGLGLTETWPWPCIGLALALQKPSIGLGLTKTRPWPWRCLTLALQRPGLGLGLKETWPWPGRSLALAFASKVLSPTHPC